jgi:very-short-patch-repair endonuclease
MFIEKSIKIHGNKYNYDLVEYINTKIKVKIICGKHGIFEQTPSSHLTGRGCAPCGNTSSLNIVIDKDSFIKESNKIHKNKYDYSLVNYKNTKTKVKIICPTHGIFEQQPNNHIFGKGCGRCGKTKKLNLDIFLLKSNEIHNFKYDYSLVNFINVKTKVKIKCPIHNTIFEQTPNHHMKGIGCPICNESTGEKEIRIFFEKNNIIFERQKTFDGCIHKKKLQFDFYLSQHNICIEFDGLQHYQPIEWFGGIESLKISKIRDQIKNKFCKENNINLIRIKYDENILDKLLFLSDI